MAQLATAFVNSEWLATDIALAAARSGDATRILRVVAHSPNGRSAISAIERDIQTIQPPWRQTVQDALHEMHRGVDE